MTLHQLRTHSQPQEGCFGCKLSSVQSNTGVLRTLAQQRRDMEVKQYERARAEGSLPMASRLGEQALRDADRLGRPFRSDDLAGTYHPEHVKELKFTNDIIRPEVVQKTLEAHT